MNLYDINGNAITNTNSNNNIHSGENCLCLGDSNMQFMSGMVKWTLNNLFQGIGMSCTTYAMSGAQWYHPTYNDLNTRDTRSGIGQLNSFIDDYGEKQTVYTMCLIMLGTNDGVHGTYEDTAGTQSMVGYMRYTLDKLLSLDGFKQGSIVGVLPPHRYDNIETDTSLRAKVDLIKRVYGDYSIPVIDLYYGGNIREEDLNSADKVHLIEESYKKFTLKTRALINSI